LTMFSKKKTLFLISQTEIKSNMLQFEVNIFF